MTKKEIQKYFDRRPATDTLFVVGTIVFIDQEDAQAYADQIGLIMETKHRDDTDTSTGSVTDTSTDSLTDASTGSVTGTLENTEGDQETEGTKPEETAEVKQAPEQKPKRKK